MASGCNRKKSTQGHPCFGADHKNNGRMHLAVAPRCNIKCGYCTRRHDCANESRPGVTSRILTPDEALARVREVINGGILGTVIKVVGIAGPGDPLANEETFKTFELIGREFPHLIKCMSTNGLLLPESIDRLAGLGLGSLTVTVNNLDPDVGARIYSHVLYQGRRLTGRKGAEILLANQLLGLEKAARFGMTIKVNTVLIPGVNEKEIPLIARRVRDLGAAVMNVMPIIPQADFAGIVPPSQERIEEVRRANERIICQFRHCRQCRADAVGPIGEDLSFQRSVSGSDVHSA